MKNCNFHEFHGSLNGQPLVLSFLSELPPTTFQYISSICQTHVSKIRKNNTTVRKFATEESNDICQLKLSRFTHKSLDLKNLRSWTPYEAKPPKNHEQGQGGTRLGNARQGGTTKTKQHRGGWQRPQTRGPATLKLRCAGQKKRKKRVGFCL